MNRHMIAPGGKTALFLMKRIKNTLTNMCEFITKSNSKPGSITQDSGDKCFQAIPQAKENRISLELSPNNDFNDDLLVKLNPHFVSVTWLGTRYLELPNHEIPAIQLARRLCDSGLPVLVHLAGRNLNKERLLDILNILKNSGVKNILAVQGDWPHILEKDDRKCDFPYASNLVSFIKEHFGDQFSVGVAAYPNLHPHCHSEEDDVKFLKEKVSKGADFIITQATFEYETLENYVKICKRNKINVPIFPGIFVIKSYKSLINMAKWCEFKVPENILEFVEKNQGNLEVIESYGLDLGKNLIRKVLKQNELFAGVHIFSMNDMELMEKVMNRLQNDNTSRS